MTSKQETLDPEDERMLRALDMISNGDSVGGLFQLQRLEKEGHSLALLGIAALYECGGRGVPQDSKKAIKLYEALAEKSSYPAISALGRIYLSGVGTPQNHEKAFNYFNILAHAGVEWAQFVIGVMYQNGLHVEKDLPIAKKWYVSSAEGGHLWARHNLAIMRMIDGQIFSGLITAAANLVRIFPLLLFDRDNDKIRRI